MVSFYAANGARRTNVEAMVPMTSEQVRQEVREKRELEEMRLQNELLKTKFNRGPGDNMRHVLAKQFPSSEYASRKLLPSCYHKA